MPDLCIQQYVNFLEIAAKCRYRQNPCHKIMASASSGGEKKKESTHRERKQQQQKQRK